MSWEIIKGFVRHALGAGGTALATQGHITQDESNLVVGALMTILAVVTSALDKRKNK